MNKIINEGANIGYLEANVKFYFCFFSKEATYQLGMNGH